MTATAMARRFTTALWVMVAVIEGLLAARTVAVLIWGINGDLSAPASAPGFLYSATAPVVNPLADGANFLVPYHGIAHALDIAAVLAMIVIFFTNLALSKIILWTVGLRPTAERAPSG